METVIIEQERTWSNIKRFGFWVRLLAFVLTVAAGVTFGSYQWILTRASKDDLSTMKTSIELVVDSKLADKVNKELYTEQQKNINDKIETQQKTLDNVNDNLIRLLDYSDIKPKRVQK